jgi:ATP-dependent helicase/nuclease subunit B
MAVMVRSMEGYHDLIATVFADYGIPHFFDQKRSVLHHPLVEFLRSAVEVVLHNWHYDAVFRCVKTGLLLPLPEDNDLPWDLETLSGGMDRLENAALAYGIHGYRWTDGKPWTFRTKVSLEEEDGGPAEIMEEELKLINGCRQLVAKPLHAFQERMRKAVDVKERTQAFMELLLELRVPEKLERWSEECLQAGAPEKAREHAQVWDSVIDMFDQLVEILGEEPVSLELYGALLETGLESIKLGLVPPSLDQVLIGSMDRTRSGQIRYAFLLGVSDGVVPAKMNEDGLLTEQERETLAGAGLPLAEGSRRKLLDEQFIAYSALCSPSRRLWISYPLADEEGKSLLPSELVHQLLHLFPGLQERLILAEPSPVLPEEEQAEFIAHPDKALAYLGVQLKQWLRGERIPELWWTVYDWFARRPEWESKLKLLVTALFYTNKENPLTVPTSRSIYGDRLQASVSRMERYAACPFSHFISHGLKLQERKVYRLEAPDIGQLFHAALHQFVRQLQEERVDWGALTAEESYARTSQLVDRLAPQLQGEILLSSSRFGYISRKLKAAVGKAAVMLTEHARRGEFVPLGLEVDFGPGGPLPPLTFRLYNGCMMDIIGRIDRVDGAGGDGKLLLRVIDYKSGPTSLQLPEVYYGLSLQMLTYLDVLVTHSKRWLGAEAVPAGVLYFHVHNPLLQQKNRPDPGEAEAQLRKRFKMRGLVTADAEIARKMDGGLREKNGYSELIPVAVKADGSFYKSSSVVTEGQWDRLREFVRGQIKRIGTGITDGQVDIAPYRLGKKAACRHCNYRAVCQFDPQFEGNGYKLLVPLGKEEVWSELEKTASDSAALER